MAHPFYTDRTLHGAAIQGLRIRNDAERARERAYNAGYTLAEVNDPKFLDWVDAEFGTPKFYDAVAAATQGDGEPFVALMQRLADQFAQKYSESNWHDYTYDQVQGDPDE